MQKNVETELKLLISKRNLKKLLASDLMKQAVRAGSQRQRHLVSSYYDTADWALKQHGIAYRVRDKGDDTFEATVKTARHNAGGLSERVELNLPLAGDAPVLDGFAELGLGYELSEIAPEGVQKLFTVDVERTTYLLDFKGAVAELAIDKGKIIAGRKRSVIEEMEIELKEGELGSLLELAEKIAALVPVFAEKRSKFARGLALLGQAGDERISKAQITEDGNIRSQVLAIVLQRGDALLALQNEVKSDGLNPDNGRELLKNLQYLGSMISFGSVFAESDKAKRAGEIAAEWAGILERLNDVAELEELWSEIAAAGSADLSKGELLAKAAEVKEDLLDAAKKLAEAGSLTEAMYTAASWLANEQWQNEEYLQPESTVRCRLQDWQDELESADDAAKIALLEKIVRLGKSVDGKQFAKLLKEAKAARSILKGDMRRGKLQQLTDELNKMGKSRGLSRDAGIVTGWLLAGK